MDCIALNLKGNVIDGITPGVKVGGEIARTHQILKLINSDLASGITIVTAQKAFSIVAFGLLLLLSTPIFIAYQLNTSVTYLFFGFGSLLLILVFLIHQLSHYLSSINFQFSNKTLNKLHTIYHKITRMIKQIKNSPVFILKTFSLSFSIWLLYGLKLFILIVSFEVEIEFLNAIAIAFVSYAVAMLPISPGGLGSFDLAMVYQLTLISVTPELSTSITVIYRFFTFWLEFFISLIYLFINKLLIIKGVLYEHK